MQRILTIGHSNYAQAAFVAMLRAHAIQVVVDVRSAPYSRYVPHFNKKEIEQAIRAAGCGYVFMGDELGGKPADPALYDGEGHPDYAKLAGRESFQAGLDRLRKGFLDGRRIVLMCAEENPTHCHRHLLIARELEFGRNIPVVHLRKDGTLLRALELFEAVPVQLGLFQR